MTNKISIIYTTTASQQDAEKIAEQVVANKLAACVNILPKTISIYKWENKIEKTQEFSIILKTLISKSELLYQWLLGNHPYKVPAILKTTVNTSPDFYNYVKQTLR